MIRNRLISLDRSPRKARKSLIPAYDALEGRMVLSTLGSLTHANGALVDHIKELQTSSGAQGPVLGTISGQVTQASNGKGFKKVKVQLIDGDGNVSQTATTNNRGFYNFKVRANGTYVVRQVQPNKFVQTSPTFINVAPTGALNPPPNAYSYSTGNSDPANGAVGPYFWDTIAQAGDLPFESPINIQGPSTDLSSVLSVHYADSVPTRIVNNGHQIQVQFPTPNPTDTITVGGKEFDLAQFHYHDPSENTVNHKGFSMEEHFLNVSATGGATVVAVFLQLGAHNNALDPILNAATTSLTTSGSSTTIATPINFAGLLPTSMQGWYFQGTLTTPPLAGPINWFVLATPINLDFKQLQQYEKVASGANFLPNNRPVQPTDGRQLNEIDFNVNFQGTSIANLNFVNSNLLQAAKARSTVH